ncbi:MAG: sulfite exporter TauE/SafE family protein [Coriobacteriales bacterium]|jgi:uncharacterized membrane protein YfcA|nr:sulfite exporter TauE/SafE family protein [Coriobacteriales bacterium]
MTIGLFILITLFGILVGVLSGMFGIGGGTLMIPLLNLVFRLPILTATATSLLVIAPTSLSGAWRHVRQGSVDVRAAVLIGLSGAVASVFSSFSADRLPSIVILAVVVIVILYSAVSVIKGALGAVLVEEGDAPARFTTRQSRAIACVCLGLFAGAVSGIAGVGGGFIIVPIGIAYFGYAFKKASGTSLLAIAFIAVPGIITHALLGHIWYLGGVALILGTMPGAYLGAHLITKVPERAARLAFGVLLVMSGALLIANRVLTG